jgi:neutral ceramidase
MGISKGVEDMQFAVAKTPITPSYPVFLAGYGGRSAKCEGVVDDLYAKAALLQDEEGQSLLILTLDALGGDRSFMTGIRKALQDAFELKAEQVLVNFSHTHCSVFLTGEQPSGRRGGYSLGQDRWPEQDSDVDYTEDIKFYKWVRDSIVELVRGCYNRLQEGSLRIGKGESQAGINRRLRTPEGLMMMPNPVGDIDRDLFALQLTDRSGAIRGILFSCACHPTSVSGNRISAEFVGAACTQLEEQHPDSVVLFLQGCAGDIKPTATVNGVRFKTLSVEEMREAGGKLASEVSAVLAAIGPEAEAEANWKFGLTDVRLFTERWGSEELEQIIADETKTDYRKRAAGRTLKALQEGRVKRDVPHAIQVWSFGRAAALVAMEGEVPAEYALRIKELFGVSPVIALGYSNGVSTYIPTRRILQEGGYEAEAFVLHGVRGPLVPENEALIIGTVALMKMELGI